MWTSLKLRFVFHHYALDVWRKRSQVCSVIQLKMFCRFYIVLHLLFFSMTFWFFPCTSLIGTLFSFFCGLFKTSLSVDALLLWRILCVFLAESNVILRGWLKSLCSVSADNESVRAAHICFSMRGHRAQHGLILLHQCASVNHTQSSCKLHTEAVTVQWFQNISRNGALRM